MLDEIDRSLERWLRASLPLAPGDGDVSFDQPERDWDARRTVPLVNMYLYSLQKSGSRSAGGTRLVATENGRYARERLAPVVEARYLVSVWGGSPGVEHELLGRLVNLLADNVEIPDDHLTDRLRIVQPHPTISLAPDVAISVTSLWSGLDVPPRPSVQLLVYSPLGGATVTPTADPPSSVHLGFSRVAPTAAYAPRRRAFGRITDPSARRRATVSIQDSARGSASVDGSNVIQIDVPPDESDRG